MHKNFDELLSKLTRYNNGYPNSSLYVDTNGYYVAFHDVQALLSSTAQPLPDEAKPNCRMQGGICACRSGGSYGGCAIECQAAGKPLFANDAQPLQQEGGKDGYPEPLQNFQEGQWWVKKLDDMAKEATDLDLKRAVAVVHHMLRSASQPPDNLQQAGTDKLQSYLDASQKLDAATDNFYGQASTAQAEPAPNNSQVAPSIAQATDAGQLPCPFCGSSNISAGEVSTDYAGGHGAQCTQSRCDDCGALGPEADLTNGEVDYGDVKAIAAWNRRSTPAQATPESGQDLLPAWITEVCGEEVDGLSYGQGYRRGFNDCREKVIAARAALAQQKEKYGC